VPDTRVRQGRAPSATLAIRHVSVGSAGLPTARDESASARRTQRRQATGTCVRRECAPHLRRRPPRPANPPPRPDELPADSGGTVAGPRGPVLQYRSRARPGIFGGGVNDGRADRISRVGHYPAHVRPGGVAGIGCGRPVAQRRARPGPGRQWDNEMQLDLMGHDPKPASR
jgi:hypothetical protein